MTLDPAAWAADLHIHFPLFPGHGQGPEPAHHHPLGRP